MNIVTLMRISDGKKYQGFLDWDKIEARSMNFYYFDNERNGWVSSKLGEFMPIPLEDEKPKAIGD